MTAGVFTKLLRSCRNRHCNPVPCVIFGSAYDCRFPFFPDMLFPKIFVCFKTAAGKNDTCGFNVDPLLILLHNHTAYLSAFFYKLHCSSLIPNIDTHFPGTGKKLLHQPDAFVFRLDRKTSPEMPLAFLFIRLIIIIEFEFHTMPLHPHERFKRAVNKLSGKLRQTLPFRYAHDITIIVFLIVVGHDD